MPVTRSANADFCRILGLTARHEPCGRVCGLGIKLALLWLAGCIDKSAFRLNMRAIIRDAEHAGALMRGHRKRALDAVLPTLGLGMGVSAAPSEGMDYVDAVWAATELSSEGRIVCPPTPTYPGCWAHATGSDGRATWVAQYDDIDRTTDAFFIAVDYEGTKESEACVYATLAIMLNANIQFFVVTCSPLSDPDAPRSPITSGPPWLITLLKKAGVVFVFSDKEGKALRGRGVSQRCGTQRPAYHATSPWPCPLRGAKPSAQGSGSLQTSSVTIPRSSGARASRTGRASTRGAAA